MVRRSHRRRGGFTLIELLVVIAIIAVSLDSDPARQYTGYGWRAARSRHPGGVHVLLGDGAVRFVGDNIDLATWRGLATRSGREAVQAPAG